MLESIHLGNVSVDVMKQTGSAGLAGTVGARALAVALPLPTLLWQPPRAPFGQFDVLAVDVGQGNAVLVRTANHALLYDTGPRYTYDAIGNLLTTTDARGHVTTRTYGPMSRLTRIAYSSGPGVTITYGTTPRTGSLGEVIAIGDESGTLEYTYDAASRITVRTQTTRGKTFVTRYAWGDSGAALEKIIAITYPSGNQVTYSYDVYARVSAVSVAAGNGTDAPANAQILLRDISYNASYQITGWHWASGNVQTIGYDGLGQMVGYNLGNAGGTGNKAGVRRMVSYDPGGRITAYTHTSTSTSPPTAITALDQAFAYDNLNRLVRTSQGSTAIAYRYDDNGNRTARVINANTYTNAIAPDSNQLRATQDVLGRYTFTHDAAGNVTADGINTFTYSPRGRLASVNTPAGTMNYLYNALEQRVYKQGTPNTMAGGASYYVHDEAGRLLGEYDGNGKALFETIYLGSVPVGVMKQVGTAANSGANASVNVKLYQVYADHLGAPRLITDMADTIVWRWDAAEAFGGTSPDQNPTGAGVFVYDQRLPGQVFDSETGLFDNWYRDYDARQGRYRQSDPIGLAGGINTYSYVSGNPLSGTDPQGLFLNVIVGGFIGGVSGYLGAASDPCTTTSQRLIATLGGAGIGALTSFVPVGGYVLGSVIRNGFAGAAGNYAGQWMTGNGISSRQVVSQGAIAGVGGGVGNIGAMSIGAGLVSETSLNTGTLIGMLASLGVNGRASTQDGGLRGVSITDNAGCTCKASTTSQSSTVEPQPPNSPRPWTQSDFLYGYGK